MPDRAIAPILSRAGKVTGRQNGWTQSAVCTLRNRMGVPVYRDGERQRGGGRPESEPDDGFTLDPEQHIVRPAAMQRRSVGHQSR
jgi:hypothetical protein